jgi:uncharacterized protein YqgV (UPF0045/DUF77 family)
MRRIFTRPSIAVEADIDSLNVTAALNAHIEQMKNKEDSGSLKETVEIQNEEGTTEGDATDGNASSPDDTGVDGDRPEDQTDPTSDQPSSGEPVVDQDQSINADVEDGLDEEIANEALACLDDGKALQKQYSYEAYKAFKSRSNNVLNTLNVKLGLEDIHEDAYLIDSEELAQEDIKETLKLVGAKIMEFIKATIAFIKNYVNLIKSDTANFQKKYSDYKEILETLKDGKAKTVKAGNWSILLPTEAEANFNNLNAGVKTVAGFLDNYFNHFKVHYPAFSTSVNKLVEDFTHFRSITGTLALKAETKPSMLRPTNLVPGLKAPNENMSAFVSSDVTDDVFMAAWIGNDPVVNLGESNSIFDSKIVLTRGDAASTPSSEEYPTMPVASLKVYLAAINTCIEKMAYAEASMAVCANDLAKLEKSVGFYSNVKMDGDDEKSIAINEQIEHVQKLLSKLVGLYKTFYIDPTKSVCSYGKHFITTGFTYVNLCIKAHTGSTAN